MYVMQGMESFPLSRMFDAEAASYFSDDIIKLNKKEERKQYFPRLKRGVPQNGAQQFRLKTKWGVQEYTGQLLGLGAVDTLLLSWAIKSLSWHHRWLLTFLSFRFWQEPFRAEKADGWEEAPLCG